ncbi:MAG: Crp/Fnr family transcriptional regulator [Bacteroidetes bacterium]|nr:Crp/Fnr family transcriptional regulator [Bacteroidota bacterium]MBU1115495.1 Crp/Fnr family transcriptional regulator [Bacteroidota bacterium]MBU1798172.1 Crp/Fnr family transcriptional regulator [Bacteroidota bacterium]
MSDKSKLWYLENFNLFELMEKSKMMELDSMTSMQEIKKSQPIYFAEDPSNSIFFLKKGRVKLTRISKEGKELIVALINPGDVFGEMAILDDGERTDFATTMEESLICAISKNDFKQFIEKNPKLNLEITKLIGFRMRKYSERIEDLVFKDAEQRVISFIYNLALEQGKKIGEQIFLKPFLTHQNIAELTACSRQTVNTILTDLRVQGLIDFDRKKLIIQNEKELKKLK